VPSGASSSADNDADDAMARADATQLRVTIDVIGKLLRAYDKEQSGLVNLGELTKLANSLQDVDYQLVRASGVDVRA
jgi:hypothetical protein